MIKGGGITVQVRVFGFNQKLAEAKCWPLILPEDSRMGDLLTRCRVDEGLELPASPVVILNGRNVQQLAGEDTHLADGDEVTLMRPIAGG